MSRGKLAARHVAAQEKLMPKNPTLVLVLGFIAGCGAAVAAPMLIPPAHAQTTQRWEMLCAPHAMGVTAGRISTEMADIGNRAGAEGWEPAIAHPGVICFKRPAP